jgi:hypothetical protein
MKNARRNAKATAPVDTRTEEQREADYANFERRYVQTQLDDCKLTAPENFIENMNPTALGLVAPSAHDAAYHLPQLITRVRSLERDMRELGDRLDKEGLAASLNSLGEVQGRATEIDRLIIVISTLVNANRLLNVAREHTREQLIAKRNAEWKAGQEAKHGIDLAIAKVKAASAKIKAASE